MKRALLLNSLMVALFLLSGSFITMIDADAFRPVNTPDMTPMDRDTEKKAVEPKTGEEASADYVLLDDLIDMGYATEYVTSLDSALSQRTVGWKGVMPMAPPSSPGMVKDENDGPGNATEATDGFTYYDNVTTKLSGGQLIAADMDWFYFNLTADSINNKVDKVTIDIWSDDAEDQDAPLIAQFGTYYLSFLQGAPFDVMSWKMTGGRNSNHSRIESTVEATGTYYLILFTNNATTLNYSIEVDITSITATNTEWNAVFPYGTFVNSTNLPARMQVADQANDTYDWWTLDGLITDAGMDTSRGDAVRLGFKIEEATAFKGKQNVPFGSTYGTVANTCAITWAWVIYNNYTEYNAGQPSLHLVMLSSSTPFFVSSVFGTGGGPLKSTNIVFQDQIDSAWIGINPNQLWYDDTTYAFGCDSGAHVQYNITNLNVDLLPPNSPPYLSSPIQDQFFDEDTGPWNVTDLLEHFTDVDTITPLEFQVTKPVGATNPKEIKVTVEEGRYLWVNVTKPNWYGEGTYKIKCLDWGVEDPTISVDDREAWSNEFTITINPVNDPAYIEKVDVGTGSVENRHLPIPIPIQQGAQWFKSKKVYGRDNDTEDQDRLIYTHNSTLTTFSLNTNGQMDFVPSNDDVGNHLLRIWVDDGKGDDEDDYVDLLFMVSNRNDKPTLTEIEWGDGARSFDLTEGEDTPTFKNVREDLEINLTVTASDPDILIGQPDSLTWTVGGVDWHVYNHPTDPLKAYVTYTPTNDDAVATMVESSLFCMDNANAMSQEITIRLMIENVNDKPEILTINSEIPKQVGALKKVSLTQETGIYALEDEMFSIRIAARDIDPRDSIKEFRISDPSFQFFPDPLDPFSGNFTMRPTQEMVGIHTVIITIEDEYGDTDSVTVEFEVVNTNDPPCDFKVDWETPVDLVVGNNITFYVENLDDPDGDELTVTWDFGDATPLMEGEIVTHSFANDQSYIITVTVSDPSGASKEKTRTITIYPKEVEVDPNLDSDGDGMPDVYEDENGLNKNVNDADRDNDRDGFTNYEEYLAGTSPINENSHPPKEETADNGINWILIIVVIVIVLLVLLAVGFLFFALTRNPKPVVQQQAYGYEGQGPPPGAVQQLPGQGAPGLPPGEAGTGVAAGAATQGLPPAENPSQEETEEEEALPDTFLEQAAEVLRQEQESVSEEEGNVWKPPVEEESGGESKLDDLFSEPPEEEEAPAGEKDEGGDDGAPESSPFPDLPPPPPEP